MQSMEIIKKERIQYKKNDIGLFICPTCNITKENQSTMHYHIKTHKNESQHICKYCNKSFLHKNMLDVHMKSRHSQMEEKSFPCVYENCKAQCNTKAQYMVHFMRIHAKEECQLHQKKNQTLKTSLCTHCDRLFESDSAFYYHSFTCFPPNESSPLYQKYQDVVSRFKI